VTLPYTVTLVDRKNTRLVLPVTPEDMRISWQPRENVLESIRLGELHFPLGRSPRMAAWDAFLPGNSLKPHPIINAGAFQDPEHICGLLTRWRDGGSRLSLSISRTGVGFDCYVSSFEHHRTGGFGNVPYHLELTEYRSIRVVQKDKSGHGPSTKTGRTNDQHLTLPGESLYVIAKTELGDGSRWSELYDLNAEAIGPDPENLHEGLTLLLPQDAA
jgi:hypothetical protein